MSIGIVTDSSCDLPSATLLKMGIAAVPLNIYVGNEVYQDWQNLEPSTLFQWMIEENLIPTTSPPNTERFTRVYERYLNAFDHIVSIHLSSELSDTFFYAQEAAEELGAVDRIHCIDSQVASTALASIVLAVAEDANRGATLDEVLWKVRFIRDQSLTLFCPASYKWLEASGRVDPARNLVGSALKRRPVLSFAAGDLVHHRAIRQGQVHHHLVSRISERFNLAPIHLCLALAGRDRTDIEALKRAMERTNLNITKGRVQMIGAVIGTHLGPGTLSVTAYPEPSLLLSTG